MKSFSEFVTIRNKNITDDFLYWVENEGMYLPPHLLEQETKAHALTMYKEGLWPFGRKTVPATNKPSFPQDTPETRGYEDLQSMSGPKGISPEVPQNILANTAQQSYLDAVKAIKDLMESKPKFKQGLSAVLRILKHVLTTGSTAVPSANVPKLSKTAAKLTPDAAQGVYGDDRGDQMKNFVGRFGESYKRRRFSKI